MSGSESQTPSGATQQAAQLDAAVVLIIFNRPDKTRKVFEQIEAARPKRLWVIADGPRPELPDEVPLTQATRSITEDITWECDVHRIYSDINLGCRRRVISGLDAVFEAEERAIILEDDCVPHPTFFRYCTELLERYDAIPEVALIHGNRFVSGRTNKSYGFSQYAHIWGWATWRRTWDAYDGSLQKWDQSQKGEWLHARFPSPAERLHWKSAFDAVAAGRIDTWDYQLNHLILDRKWLVVVPTRDLIQNIGFGADATHTTGPTPWWAAAQPAEGCIFPLHHPRRVKANRSRDRAEARLVYGHASRVCRAARKVKRLARRVAGRAKQFERRTAGG